MSGFAERLVARGAGRPTGLPLLTPRPAARFERELVAPVDTETPVEPPTEGPQPAATAARKSESVPARGEAQTNPGKPAEGEADKKTSRTEPGSSPPQPSAAARPLTPAPSPASPATDVDDRITAAKPGPAALRQKPAEDETSGPPPPLFFEEPRAPIVRTIPQIERTPAAPTISIGRIDVQFLPQDRPTVQPRPEPQRTRGFEAYARARRGQPR